MKFVEAIKSGFKNYVNFKGRAARSEYWYWILFVILASIVLQILDTAILGYFFLSVLFSLATFLPSLTVGVRRLHDIDRSGFWILLSFIPIIGAIILIIWFSQKGTDGANRFGADTLDKTNVAAIPDHK